jgi:hypothetical protein
MSLAPFLDKCVENQNVKMKNWLHIEVIDISQEISFVVMCREDEKRNLLEQTFTGFPS